MGRQKSAPGHGTLRDCDSRPSKPPGNQSHWSLTSHRHLAISNEGSVNLGRGSMSGQGCAPSGEAAEIDLKFPGRKGQWLSPTPDIFSGGSGLILPLGSEMTVVASTSEPCTWYPVAWEPLMEKDMPLVVSPLAPSTVTYCLSGGSRLLPTLPQLWCITYWIANIVSSQPIPVLPLDLTSFRSLCLRAQPPTTSVVELLRLECAGQWCQLTVCVFLWFDAISFEATNLSPCPGWSFCQWGALRMQGKYPLS